MIKENQNIFIIANNILDDKQLNNINKLDITEDDIIVRTNKGEDVRIFNNRCDYLFVRSNGCPITKKDCFWGFNYDDDKVIRNVLYDHNPLPNKKCKIFTIDYNENIRKDVRNNIIKHNDKFEICGFLPIKRTQKIREPSTGFITIDYFTKKYINNNIYLIGFDFHIKDRHKQNFHSFLQEEIIVKELVKNNKKVNFI